VVVLVLIVVAATGVVVVVALAAILVEVAVLVVFGVIIEKKWLDLCGGERVYVFMFPDINILNVGGTLSIFMSLCRKNIK
jgi:hypothetical protein